MNIRRKKNIQKKMMMKKDKNKIREEIKMIQLKMIKKMIKIEKEDDEEEYKKKKKEEKK